MYSRDKSAPSSRLVSFLKALRIEEFHTTEMAEYILTREYIYKLKRQSSAGGDLYDSLEKRKRFSQMENDLGLRFSDNYRGLVKIIERESSMEIGEYSDPFPAVEYLIRIERPASSDYLENALKEGSMSMIQYKTLGQFLAESLSKVNADGYKALENRGPTAMTNYIEGVLSRYSSAATANMPISVFHYTKNSLISFIKYNVNVFKKRVLEGFVRNGHGNLNPSNIFIKRQAFQAIEPVDYNEQTRYCDVVHDLSRLLVHLDVRGYVTESDTIAEGFFSRIGDKASRRLLFLYKALELMEFYSLKSRDLSYFDISSGEYLEVSEELNKIGNMIAINIYGLLEPRAIILSGLMGVGKTKLAKELEQALGTRAIHLDAVRKTLAGFDEKSKVREAYGSGIYSKSNTIDAYRLAGEMANKMLAAGRVPVVDAAIITNSNYNTFLEGYERQNPERIYLISEIPTIKDRLDKRHASDQFADTNSELLESQLTEFNFDNYTLKMECGDIARKNVDSFTNRLFSL